MKLIILLTLTDRHPITQMQRMIKLSHTLTIHLYTTVLQCCLHLAFTFLQVRQQPLKQRLILPYSVVRILLFCVWILSYHAAKVQRIKDKTRQNTTESIERQNDAMTYSFNDISSEDTFRDAISLYDRSTKRG